MHPAQIVEPLILHRVSDSSCGMSLTLRRCAYCQTAPYFNYSNFSSAHAARVQGDYKQSYRCHRPPLKKENDFRRAGPRRSPRQFNGLAFAHCLHGRRSLARALATAKGHQNTHHLGQLVVLGVPFDVHEPFQHVDRGNRHDRAEKFLLQVGESDLDQSFRPIRMLRGIDARPEILIT
jgi:hypothetical protein